MNLLREYIRSTLGSGGLAGRIITPKRPILIRGDGDDILLVPGVRYIITNDFPLRIAREAAPYAGTRIKRHYRSPPGKSQRGIPSGHHMYSRSTIRKGDKLKNLNDFDFITEE